MQVKYKVNINDKAILNKRTLDRIDNELDKRKFIRNILRIVVIGIILVIVIYLIVSGRKEGMRIAENYDNLKANLKDSKRSFDRRVKLFEKDADGNIILTDTTLSSLAEAAQEEVVGTPASTPVNGAGTFKPVDSNMINGTQVPNITASNGMANVSVYTGIPKDWDATGAEYITVDETILAWKAWFKQEFGRDYPYDVQTAVHQDRYRINSNSTVKDLNNGVNKVSNVDCLLCAPPKFWYTNTFTHNTDTKVTPGCYDYKYMVIMKAINGDEKVYVPLLAGDGKGHTWPGGVLQTTIAHPSDDYDGGGFLFDKEGGAWGTPGSSYLFKGNDPALSADQAKNTGIDELLSAQWWDSYSGDSAYVLKDNGARVCTFNVELLSQTQPAQDLGVTGYEIYGIVRCPYNDGENQTT